MSSGCPAVPPVGTWVNVRLVATPGATLTAPDESPSRPGAAAPNV